MGEFELEFTGERMIPGKVDIELEIEHRNRYLFARHILQQKHILDVACGCGYGTLMLAENNIDTVGVDISAEAIEYAQENFYEKNVKYVCASVDKLPFKDHSFDGIVSFETIEHVDEDVQDKFLKEIKRLITPDGVLIMSTPNHDVYMQRGENHFHKKELTLNEFKKKLQKYFKFINFFSQQFEICNVIVPTDSGNAEVQNGFNLEKAEYLLAVCSNQSLINIDSQVYVRTDDKYKNLTEWAVSNHITNEQKNEYIDKQKIEIESFATEKTDLEKDIQNKEDHIELLLQGERDLKAKEQELVETIAEKKHLLDTAIQEEELLKESFATEKTELKQDIQNKEGHIELLLQGERDLKAKEQELIETIAEKKHLLDVAIQEGEVRLENVQLCHREEITAKERFLKEVKEQSDHENRLQGTVIQEGEVRLENAQLCHQEELSAKEQLVEKIKEQSEHEKKLWDVAIQERESRLENAQFCHQEELSAKEQLVEKIKEQSEHEKRLLNIAIQEEEVRLENVQLCHQEELSAKERLVEKIKEQSEHEKRLLDTAIQEGEVRLENVQLCYQEELSAKERLVEKIKEQSEHEKRLLDTAIQEGKERLEDAQLCYQGEISAKEQLLEGIKNQLEDVQFYYCESIAVKEQLLEEKVELEQAIQTKKGHIELLLQSERDLLRNLLEEKADLEQDIQNKESHIEFLLQSEMILLKEKADLEQDIQNKEGHIELLLQSERDLLKEKADLEQDIQNKEEYIELLLKSDREVDRIKNSRSWRMMSVLWKISDIVLPRASKRRLFVKITVKFLTHPIRFLTKATPSRIELKKEDSDDASRQLNDSLIDHDIPNTILDIAEDIEVAVQQNQEDYAKFIVPTWKKPLVSIIIPVYNQFDYTYKCIESIVKNSGDITYEILIADDSSNDLTTGISDVISGLVVIVNPINLRFLKNCNNAAKYAKGNYILFLNNDTQVQENWLEPLVTLIESKDDIGMVGSKLVYPDGRLQEAGGILWKDGSAWNYGHCSNPEEPEYNYVKEVDYISGAAIMIRKSLWVEIGGFDECFTPAYYEDSDLAFEVRRHGYKVLYQPLSIVVHFEGASNGTDTSEGQKAYQVINQKKFYEKWQDVLEKEHNPNGEDVFIVKDKSIAKKHILVVDHYVPHYDKDAGGKCTYMYIKLFLSMGLKVTFIGDNFFPHQPYTTELQQMGAEVLCGNYYYNNWKEWLKENSHYFDYAYLNRAHIAIKYIDLLKKYSNAKIIYFGHDLSYLREYRQYLIDNDPNTLIASQQSKQREFELFSKADIIHVVGSYEQSILQEEFLDKPIRNIPVYIYETLKSNESVNTNFEEREDLIFVGGFGHPPNIDAVLWFASEIFPYILKVYQSVKWYIVGSNVPESILNLKSDNIIVTGFISDEELDELYAVCRISVVPLRVGAGVKGKVVEALYNRIPLLTTPIGAEGLSLEENAFLVCEPDISMAEKIIALYKDYGRLKELSENSKHFIKNHFTKEIACKIVQNDIDNL